MKLLGSALFFCTIMFLSCSKEEIYSNETLVFGFFAGQCVGDCFQAYKLTTDQLYADKTERLEEDLKFDNNPSPEENFELAQTLLTDFPNVLIDSEKERYGCPDCADQGGIYLELHRNGTRRTWTIDTNDVDQSQEIIEYKNLVFEIVMMLR